MAITEIDPKELRSALGAFLTGVTIVTTSTSEGEARGFTANSFTSVSLDPPLVLVCPGKTASSFPAFSQARTFAVNILAEEQRDVSSAFASKTAEKFAHGDWRPSQNGNPLLDKACAWLDCVTHDIVDAGDHVILIGRVVNFGRTTRTPLGYHSGSYVTFSAARQAIESPESEKRVVAGIFEKDGRILLVREGATWRLPRARTLGEDGTAPESLLGTLDREGVKARVNFLYTVAEEPEARLIHVCYRGQIDDGPPSGHPRLRLFDQSEIPWDSLPGHPEERHIINRYFNERAHSQFGVYVGTLKRGEIQTLAPRAEASPGA